MGDDLSIFKRIILTLPFIAPLIWLTSFFAKRRSETNMLLQEYTHKTIFAKSYLAYKEHIEKQGYQDPKLLSKLLDTNIDTLKRNPAYIFSKKHSSDMPIEELQKITEFVQKLKEIVTVFPYSSSQQKDKD